MKGAAERALSDLKESWGAKEEFAIFCCLQMSQARSVVEGLFNNLDGQRQLYWVIRGC